MIRMKNGKLFLIAMLLILTAAISGCVEKAPPQNQTNVVEIKDFSFQAQFHQYISGNNGDLDKQ